MLATDGVDRAMQTALAHAARASTALDEGDFDDTVRDKLRGLLDGLVTRAY